MSIEAAAKELTKEIDRLLKEAARLTRLRDDMLSGPENETGTRMTLKKSAAKKIEPAKKAAKKRTLSAEGRKAISDAAKKRWAVKKKAAAPK